VLLAAAFDWCLARWAERRAAAAEDPRLSAAGIAAESSIRP